MPDAWRAYLDLALGLTEAPRKRAQRVAGELVSKGGATAAQLQGLVDDLLSAGVANREALTNLVRYEVERALNVVGLATAEEVTELKTRLRDLEDQLRQAEDSGVGGGATGGTRLEEPAPLPRKAAKKAAVPNAMPSAGTTPAAPLANTSRVAGAPAKKAVAEKAVAEKAVAKKAVAKKVAAEDTVTAGAAPIPPAKKVAKKAVAKKTPASETATGGAVPVGPAKRAAIGEPTPPGDAIKAVKKAAEKKAAKSAPSAPVKKAAKKAVAPAGTAEAPTAGVREAAAETILPPLSAPETPAPVENKPGPEA
ncbi:phasin family protein [Actinoplanes sp. NPDC048988]|uniref:phasin family protein n=1 Tax=Actinoplanes sp. NPDC048988 TaxID=3363901 RepID=UPI00372113B6